MAEGFLHAGTGGASAGCAPVITRWEPVVRLTTRRVAVVPIGIPKISMNAPADCGRSAGTFPIAAKIACSTSSGTLCLTMRTLGTASMACLAMIMAPFFPVKGGSPASIS